MNEDILVTFVVDVYYDIKEFALQKYSSNRLYKKIEISLDLNIIREINHKYFYAKFICVTEPLINNNKETYQRLFLVYEVEAGDASFFVYEIKKEIMTLFKEKINNEILKIKSFELMNEKINYDYYKGYWDAYTLISDSPRLYSPRSKK